MKSLNIISSVTTILILAFLLNSCSSSKPIAKSDIDNIKYLKIVRTKTPELSTYSLGGVLLGFTLFGAVGAEIAMHLDAPTTSNDFGEIIMYRFAERIYNEVPNLPEFLVRKEPVINNYSFQGTLLKIEVKSIMLHGKGGFMSIVNFTMKQPDGHLIWKKGYLYWGEKLGRFHTIKEFKADNGKLLKEEIEFATNNIVSVFVEDFKENFIKAQ